MDYEAIEDEEPETCFNITNVYGVGLLIEQNKINMLESEVIEGIEDWTDKQLLENIVQLIEEKNFKKVRCVVAKVSDKSMERIYRDLFKIVIDKCDSLSEKDKVLRRQYEGMLMVINAYGTKDDYSVILESSYRVYSWHVFLLLASFLEELFCSKLLTECCSNDLRNTYLSLWIDRLKDTVVKYEPEVRFITKYYSRLETDYFSDSNRLRKWSSLNEYVITVAIPKFFQIFAVSKSRRCDLLDELLDKVLPFMYVPSTHMGVFIKKLNLLYNKCNRNLPLHTLTVVSSLKSKFCSFPLLYMPEYRLKIIIPALQHSLHISSSNMFNVSYVALVLRHSLHLVKNGSVGRDQLAFFLDFLSSLLLCCEEWNLHNVREVCADLVRTFLFKFESQSRVLIIRALFKKMSEFETQNDKNKSDEQPKLKTQILAWIVDLYRFNMTQEAFIKELGYFWNDIITKHYSSLSDGLHFYLSAFVLAQEQCLRRMKPEIISNVYYRFLQPFQKRLSDWTTLLEKQDDIFDKDQKPVGDGNLKSLEMQTHLQMDRQALPLLQFQYLQTITYVCKLLEEENRVL